MNTETFMIKNLKSEPNSYFAIVKSKKTGQFKPIWTTNIEKGIQFNDVESAMELFENSNIRGYGEIMTYAEPIGKQSS